MAVTDADQLIEVQWRVLEDVNFTSALWTLAEVAGYFNQRENQFNRDTKLMLAYEAVPVVNGSTQVALPTDWIATQRATWRDTPTGAITVMERSDRFAAMAGIPATGGPTRPTLLDDHSAGTLVAEIFPPAPTDGTLGLLYASTLELLNFNPAAPDLFDVPDEFVPYVTYGVLADMLSKDGRGQDLPRAQYCESRYQEGVALAAILLGGFL